MPEYMPELMIDVSEDYERRWFNYLAEFKEKIYPIFEKHKISLGMALNIWMMNQTNMTVQELLDWFESEEEERNKEDYEK